MLPSSSPSPGEDGFIDLGQLPVPPPSTATNSSVVTSPPFTSDSSDSDSETTSPLDLLAQMKSGGASLLSKIKKQEYKHPQETRTSHRPDEADLPSISEDVKTLDITSHISSSPVGSDALPSPSVYFSSSLPPPSWRSHLSPSILLSAPSNLKPPPTLDSGAASELESLKELNQKEGAFRDQYDRKSGYRKPESYKREESEEESEGNDDEEE
ncbi:hypothetical protein TrVE_jg9297 [Triparma verrucosa]|uniref:Uncharacterized protein n=1 Tax=Triparma verrucosa TaxID=1606542 RepID=A0A9W7F9R8_9STRA|nr:hypothetical protein TrVE_jg9297 [Triparma verrucosa]